MTKMLAKVKNDSKPVYFLALTSIYLFLVILPELVSLFYPAVYILIVQGMVFQFSHLPIFS